MNILNTEPRGYSRKAYEILDSIGNVIEEECDRDRLLALIPKINILIVRLGQRIDEELFEKAVDLKIIVTATTGLNHIDLDAAAKHGVNVLSLKGERAFLDTLTATAELTWALLLALVRKLPKAIEHVNHGEWNRDLFKGNQLKEKVLGIVGYGRLGSIIARYGKAFDMHVIATDPYEVNMDSHVEKVEMAELVSSADVISLHVNYDETTHGMMDETIFKKVKPGALLINTSRGELIDEEAMLKALDTGILSGIALDVLSYESDKTISWPKDSDVWKRLSSDLNILITPHIGGVTFESMEETEVFMANKLKRYING
ncbi:NAD(P)-binding domain-containing protein [Candidatus Thioglobus sp.]|nr:NAD(P)-binding domain-containing protein [Candidatus Thioglobus sp.]